MGKDPGKQPPDKSCLQDAAAAAATIRHKVDAMEQEQGNQALKQLFSVVRTPELELQSVLESEEELELESELELEESEVEQEKTAGSKQTKQTNVDSEKKELESFSDSFIGSLEKVDNPDTQRRCYEKGVLDTCESQIATSNKCIPVWKP